MRLQNLLQLPFKDGEPRWQANMRALEAWANGPKDGVVLADQPEFPPLADFPDDTLVKVNGEVHVKRGDRWQPALRNDNTPPLLWSLEGDLTAATPYLDDHIIDVPFDCIVEKAVVHVRPTVAVGQTCVLRLYLNESVVLTLTVEDGGRDVDFPDLALTEDDEMQVEVEHSATVTGVSVQLTLRCRVN